MVAYVATTETCSKLLCNSSGTIKKKEKKKKENQEAREPQLVDEANLANIKLLIINASFLMTLFHSWLFLPLIHNSNMNQPRKYSLSLSAVFRDLQIPVCYFLHRLLHCSSWMQTTEQNATYYLKFPALYILFLLHERKTRLLLRRLPFHHHVLNLI